uniref:exosome component 10-like n=1 Tax=Styela clava TaxID=7725 RepID=UPI0019394A92|nr:exosome component 10-like [Styela clava]
MDANSDKGFASGSLGDVDEYSKKVLSALMTTIKASSSLPHSSDDFDLYSSFPGFRAFYNKQGSRILSNINSFLHHQGIKTLPQTDGQTSSGNVDVDDHYDRIVEANDMMLEQISTLLEQATAPKKDNSQPDTDVVIQQPLVFIPKTKPVVSSWNRENKYGKQQTFKLFHAHNIMRPQTKFKDKIDNSNLPFVPKITEKPNAVKQLPKALVNLHSQSSDGGVSLAIVNLVRQGREYNAEDQNIYGHPYETELANLKFLNEQLQRVEPQKYDPFPSEPCQVITNINELLDVIEHLKSCPEFAVDLEHHSYRSFQGITCLMQISSRSKDFLIDTLELRSEIHRFNEVFTNPNIVKVFHGADFDVHWLQRDFGVYVVNMFDTGQAAREMCLGHFSLDYLLQKYCDVHADKKYQLADWRIRPIPEEMRKYAQEDTHYLLYVYDIMKNELLDLGASGQASGTTRLLNTLYRSRDVCLRKYEKFLLTPTSHLKLYERRKSRKQLNNKQLELLKLLFEWRDTMARQEDESPGYVLPNHMLFQIAEIMPREAQGVLACCNPVPPLVRQHVHAIHQLVLEARAKGSGKKTDASHISTPTEVPVPAKPDEDAYDDILTCPHDLSNFDLSTPNTKPKPPQVSTAPQSSFLCNDGRPQPLLTGQSSNPTSHMQEANWDPFSKYFPPKNNLPNAPTKCITSLDDVSLKTMLSLEYAWKLKNLHGDKQEQAEEKKVVQKQKQQEEDVIILSNLPQVHGQKRHPQPNQDKKMSRHAKKKAKKLAVNSDIQPFEYTQEHYKRFHYHKK